jgi:hypothetical protein
MMRNFRIENALLRLRELYQDNRLPPVLRQHLYQTLHDVETGAIEMEDHVRELEELLLRNPAFPGDIIGWWDDDYGEDEDAEEDNP